MTKTLHGKVRGKTIKLDEDPGVAEGQEVEVLMKVVTPPCSVDKPAAACQPEAAPKKLPGPPPGWKPGAPSKVGGCWRTNGPKRMTRLWSKFTRTARPRRGGSRWRSEERRVG